MTDAAKDMAILTQILDGVKELKATQTTQASQIQDLQKQDKQGSQTQPSGEKSKDRTTTCTSYIPKFKPPILGRVPPHGEWLYILVGWHALLSPFVHSRPCAARS